MKTINKLAAIFMVAFFAFLIFGFASGTVTFNLFNRGKMRSTGYIHTDTYLDADSYVNADTYVNASGYVKAGDSLAVGSTNFIQKITRTSYGDSLVIIVYAKHTGKDTAFLPLN